MLIAGKERQFLSWFHNSEAVNARAFTNEVEDIYACAYSTPGALRAGFDYYRAFPEDAKVRSLRSAIDLLFRELETCE